MSAFTKEELIHIAHRVYPKGHPVETDDYSQPLLAYQRTPEYARWDAAWDKALTWKECDTLVQEVIASFPTSHVGRFSQPRMASCVYCIVSQEKTDSRGGRLIEKVVGALSVLAPAYLVYVVTELPGGPNLTAHSRLSFAPGDDEKPSVRKLVQLIERHLGYRPFPLEWAEVPLPELRVGYLNATPPTLMSALFSDELQNLP